MMKFEKFSTGFEGLSSAEAGSMDKLNELKIPEKTGDKMPKVFYDIPEKSGNRLQQPFYDIPEKSGSRLQQPVYNIPEKLSNRLQQSVYNIPEKSGSKLQQPIFNIPEKAGDNISQRFSENINKAKHIYKKVVIEHDDPRLYSEKYERMKFTPKTKGEWMGERGDSKFIPYSQESRVALGNFNLDGIYYKNGIPDFSVCSDTTIRIDKMDSKRGKNFKFYDETCADKWNREERDGRNDWTAREVKEWRSSNKYTWHERNDMKTADLVPSVIHSECKHLGGIAETKRQEAIIKGGFDD